MSSGRPAASGNWHPLLASQLLGSTLTPERLGELFLVLFRFGGRDGQVTALEDEIRVQTESAEVATTINAAVMGIMALEATVSGHSFYCV